MEQYYAEQAMKDGLSGTSLASPVYAIGDWINPCAGPGGSSSGCYEP